MPKIEENNISKRIQPIIFVINSSGNMYGSRCEELNIAMPKVLKMISNAYSQSDYLAQVAIMTYNTEVKWIPSPKLVSPDEIEWEDIVPFGGSYMGTAMVSLDNNLCRKNLLHITTGFVLPIIVWITSSGCSGFDEINFENGIKGLSDNRWFVHSTKIGINYSDEEYPTEVLKEELKMDVIQCDNYNAIYEIILFALKNATHHVSFGGTNKSSPIEYYLEEINNDRSDSDSLSTEEWSDEEW
ncbi:MAG: vWA domain-containing protein [Ruminococcus sp.]|nr:vWA domain-containing protein [Ruminococcus sp.]